MCLATVQAVVVDWIPWSLLGRPHFPRCCFSLVCLVTVGAVIVVVDRIAWLLVDHPHFHAVIND